MNRIIIFLAILVGLSHTLPAQCWTTLSENLSCNWYPMCLQQKFQCGKTGYPIGYGYKYCNKFSQLKTFPAARLWIDKTLVCLKKSLVPLLDDSVHMTCEQVKKDAYNTHPHCYQESGFCQLYHQLGFEDSALFLKQLLGIFDAKDFESILAVKQIEQLVQDCWKGQRQ